VSLIVGSPGQSVVELVTSIASVVTQTTFEVVCVGAQGLPDVAIPATNLDLAKRRYEITRPLFAYASNGAFPIQPDTGVYLSNDLGTNWQSLDLPAFPDSADLSQPVFATRGGRLYFWFGDHRGQVARYDTQSRSMFLAEFSGTAGDLAFPRTACGLAVAPGASEVLLFAAGQQSGIWRSSNNGFTFVLSNQGQSSTPGGAAVACHPLEAGLCYAGGFVTGAIGAPLYRSTDSGVTWALVHTRPYADGDIHQIALGNDADIVYLLTRHVLLKSFDQGATFAPLLTGFNSLFLGTVVVAPSDEAHLWISIGSPSATTPVMEIYRSTDAGAHWALKQTIAFQSFGQSLTGGIAIHPTDPDRVAYAASGRVCSVVQTSDGGTTWIQAGRNLGPAHSTLAPLLGVAYGPTTQLAATGTHIQPTSSRVQIGEETIYGEIHDATITLPFAEAIVEAIADRTDETGDSPIFPLLRINKVDRYHGGTVRKTGLVEVRITRVDGRRSPSGGQVTVGGTFTHEEVARGPQAVRTVPLSLLESIEDSTTEFSATMPGIHTEWQAYDTVLLNSKTLKIAAIRYSITVQRRLTVLGFAVTDTLALDRSSNTAGAHPRLTIGRPPTVVRRGR
jgi:photosystem II stability/assembly factor-like uncharacterized protein